LGRPRRHQDVRRSGRDGADAVLRRSHRVWRVHGGRGADPAARRLGRSGRGVHRRRRLDRLDRLSRRLRRPPRGAPAGRSRRCSLVNGRRPFCLRAEGRRPLTCRRRVCPIRPCPVQGNPVMKFAAAATAALFLAASPTALMAQTAPAAAVAAPQPSAELAQIIADYEAWERREDPVSAGFEGDAAAQAELWDASRGAELTRRETLAGFSARLARIDPAGLNAEDSLNHAFLQRIVDMAIERIDLDVGRMAFDSEGGPGQRLGYLAGSTRITTAAEAEAYISRLGAAPRVYADVMDNARRGLETGLIQPRSTVENALALLRTEAAHTVDTDPLLAPLRNLPASIPAARQAELRARAEAIVTGPIAEQRRAWVAFLEGPYMAAAPETLGLVHRPGGRELYAYLARAYATTDLTPDQIHQLGLDEVARIRARMDEEMRASGWTGDFAGFLNFLRTDPRF